jgi:transcriptional regulator with XRE-family HTH domain
VHQYALSPDVLCRPDLRHALTEHDFTEAFRLIKQHAGLSQNAMANACGLTPGKISTIMKGSAQITSYEVLARIADGLHIPGDMLCLAPRPWEKREDRPAAPADAPPIAGQETPWQADVTVSLASQLTRSDLTMDRRALALALAATAVTGSALLDALEGWMHPAAPGTPPRRPGRLGERDVGHLEHTAKVFRSWGHQFGGGLRCKAVLGQLAEVSACLDEHQAPIVETRLYRVLAQLAGSAASMAWDAGLQRRAQKYYQLSLRAAHAGGDRLWGANVLAGMARQMLYTGRPADALELVRLAQEGARTEAGPRVRAMLHTREAWALAALGRTAAFKRATEQARTVLADAAPGDDEPYWIGYFDTAEISGTTGGRLLELARTDPRNHADDAAEQIQHALTTRAPDAGRSRALDHIGLAEVYFLVGDITAAAAQTHTAVDAAKRVQSGRVRTGLADLYQYTVGHGASRDVRDARARIREQLAD